MKQQLRKPENWQDFEDLCHVLWGEIWRCPEIKKNGRSGQNQSGVDIYGVPQGENGYYGIQCKAKDGYTKAELTIKEVDAELEKARKFKPTLKKLYFATTANKDVTIEEYIRIKDVESRKQGLFEIHLFSWGDIVSLIDQNIRTYDWYVQKKQFKSNYSVLVTFSGGETELNFTPNICRTYIAYTLEQRPNPIQHTSSGLIVSLPEDYMKAYEDHKKRSLSPQPFHYEYHTTYRNLSRTLFSFQIENTGDHTIDDFKLRFSIEGKVIMETVKKKASFLDLVSYNYDMRLKEVNGIFEPKTRSLLHKEEICSDLLCLRALVEDSQQITINWEFLSRNFHDKGQLLININPLITYQEKIFPIYDHIPEDDTLVFDEKMRRSYRLENKIEEI